MVEACNAGGQTVAFSTNGGGCGLLGCIEM
jgi:hypothetical protein